MQTVIAVYDKTGASQTFWLTNHLNGTVSTVDPSYSSI